MNSLAFKISSIIFSLVVMLACVVTATAYTSYSQSTRVAAVTTIEVNFGTVFPGITATESFTVQDNDTSDNGNTSYFLEMIEPPADSGLEDMRSHLAVNKVDTDTNETGLDLSIEGIDDTAEGIFTNNDDLDTWSVIFYVPDEPGVNYGCEINISAKSITPAPSIY